MTEKLTPQEAANRLIHINTSFQGSNPFARAEFKLDDYEAELQAILSEHEGELSRALATIQMLANESPHDITAHRWFSHYLLNLLNEEN